MPCGTPQPDGTVKVTLSWTSGTPDPESEVVRLCVPTGGCQDYVVPWHPVASSPASLDISGLAPGIAYAWSVITTFAGGEVIDSGQVSFITPGVPIIYTPASNLAAKEVDRTPDRSKAFVEFAWTPGSGGAVIGESVLVGRGQSFSPWRLVDIEIEAQQANPGMQLALGVGVWAWQVITHFADKSVSSIIQGLEIKPIDIPTGSVMPVTLWHAINYWAAMMGAEAWLYNTYRNRDIILDEIYGISAVEFFAALTAQEGGPGWYLTPCSQCGSSYIGPWQFGSEWSSELGTWGAACTAWKSTEAAIKAITSGHDQAWQPLQRSYLGSVISRYRSEVLGRAWYNLRLHRASRLCGASYTDIVFLDDPLAVTPRLTRIDSNTIRMDIIVNNLYDYWAEWVTINVDFQPGEFNPGEQLEPWVSVPGLLLAPAKRIPPHGNAMWSLILHPAAIRAQGLPYYYNVYGENVGIKPYDNNNGALGVAYGQVDISTVHTPVVPQLSVGDTPSAHVEFDHQGESVATITVATVIPSAPGSTIKPDRVVGLIKILRMIGWSEIITVQAEMGRDEDLIRYAIDILMPAIQPGDPGDRIGLVMIESDGNVRILVLPLVYKVV